LCVLICIIIKKAPPCALVATEHSSSAQRPLLLRRGQQAKGNRQKAIETNKMSKVMEFLKLLILLFIKKTKKYLLEFDAKFLISIKIYYGENAFSFKKKDENITISTDTGIITVKYIHIPIKKIIDS
jgi:hypothetical protein